MFRFINHFWSSWRHHFAAAQSSRCGQVAVIMIVIIAIGLVLFAASINLTMMSQSKTFTMKAANASAASMASYIASYGQEQYVQSMNRRVSYCKSSGGGFWSFLTLVVLIVIAVSGQYELLPAFLSGPGVTAMATIGAIMEAASIIIGSSIDPGISDMWNRMQEKNLTNRGRAVERGVQAGLQGAVTDSVKLPDLYDMDNDGLFGYPGNDQTKPPNDTIGRFSLYNTRRFLDLTGPDTAAVQAFVSALHELVVEGSDHWGLWDPVYYPDYKTKASAATGNSPNLGNFCFIPPTDLVNYPKRPAECDYCCSNMTGAIPPECDPASGQPQVGIRATCASRSPFRSPGNEYPYIYDFSYEDSTNVFMSFREELGRDDEHHLYHAVQANPNWHSDPFNAPETIPVPGDNGFFLKDTVGFYTMPPHIGLPNPDIWVSPNPLNPSGVAPFKVPSLFPFLYKMKDWGPNLSDRDYIKFPYECHWCDANSNIVCPADMAVYPEISGRLTLPFEPSGVPYNKTQGWCVNKGNSGLPNDPPLLADIVPGVPNLLVPDDQCGINSFPTPVTDLSQYARGWKAGADSYCSHTSGVLYSMGCPKSGGPQPPIPDSLGLDPQCGEAGAQPATSWPDDMIDEIIYGIANPIDGGLLRLESGLWQAQSAGGMGIAALTKELSTWYGTNSGKDTADGIADWIEPPCPDPKNCPGSFTKLARPGMIWVWRAELQFLNKQIQDWLFPPAGSEYSGATPFGPGAAWCLPPNIPFPGISPSTPPKNITDSELATFNINGNGVRGDVADVVACLNWNAADHVSYNLGPPTGVVAATGNAEKFQLCHDHCSDATCKDVLPRSLIPDFYNPVLMPVYVSYPGDEAKFLACLGSQTIDACAVNCKNNNIPSGYPYDALPVFQDPEMTKIGIIEDWCGNASNRDTPLLNACNGAVMPGGETTLYCTAIAGVVNHKACRCSWAGVDCLGIAQECLAYCPAEPPPSPCRAYADAVTLQIPKSRGSCCDPNNPPGNSCDPKYVNFYPFMQQSADEARIQVEKLKKREKFLRGRYEEAMALSYDSTDPRMKDLTTPNLKDGVLTVAIRKLTEFLDNGTANDLTDSPAERFIQARINQIQQISGDLPSFGIYVWQDQDPVKTNLAGQPIWDSGHGYWHAVKVDVRLPSRCAGNCLSNDFPKIHSTTSHSGGFFNRKTKICYDLINLSGMTKSRVIRYDQDKDLRGLLFPGGGQIWQSRFSHPLQTTPADPTGLRATCATLIDPDLKNWLNTPGDPRANVGAAFMLNKIPVDLNNVGDPYTACWLKVHQSLLAHGIQSESCAEYDFVGDPAGFRVKFVPCDRW